VGYSILLSDAQTEKNKIQDFSKYAEAFQTVFAPKYPNHPYTTKMINLLTGSSLKAGSKFIDFTASDMKGESVRLSERIAGKPTVLHLWASWCGPCRKKGKELISVYEEFRNTGFVVIGVAREKSISTAEAAIKQDKYPWENLVELNDAEQIWVKYGIGNAGGSIFLIDEKGIIVAVAPSIDEIRSFLLNRQ
jgi:peroxiredoxin